MNIIPTMSAQTNLFTQQDEPVYCFDTCAFLNILKITDDEPYAMDVMPGVLEYVEDKLGSGKIICPMAVYDELKKREDKVDGLKEWLRKHRRCFISLDAEQASVMKPIVNKYPVYSTDKGDYGDLAVVSFAKQRGLVVVTSELRKDQHRQMHPKVPNVCDEFNVPCTSLIGFLRSEGVTLHLVAAEVKKTSVTP